VPKPRGHKWFAAFWNRATRLEPKSLKRLRRKTVEGLSGRVLEIGCGTGANFEFYPDAVTLVATDPDPYMLEHARHHIAELGRPIEVQEAGAEALPFRDKSFDAVISTLVLCSVPEQDAALAEIHRVLKPGGEFHFIEHVRYGNRLGAWFQDRIEPLWVRVGGGCHPNRDTHAALVRAGFAIKANRSLMLAPPIPPLIVTRPAIAGVAVRE
jgi:ubiquinone/menaquinone biosynthesis C-methylase UbiE